MLANSASGTTTTSAIPRIAPRRIIGEGIAIVYCIGMRTHLMTGLLAVAALSCAAGTLAMFAAKLAAFEGGTFLYRAETHWFNDAITAFLLSINLLGFAVVFVLANRAPSHVSA